MMGRILAPLLGLLLAACQSSPLEREVAAQNLEGGVIVYGRSGTAPEIIELGGDAAARYPYWSLSKPIAAALVLELSKENSDLLDERAGGATLRQLLQHSGGWDRDLAGDPITLGSDNCSQPLDLPQQFAPGERQVYSNHGYCLLGRHLSDHFSRPYPDLARDVLPEVRTMDYEPRLGPAGGWSGTPLNYWHFAVRPLPDEVSDRPDAVADGPYYGLSWRVDGDRLSHFGLIHGRSFTLVARRGDFAAVAMFTNTPRDAYSARDRLVPLLLDLET